MSFLGHFKQGDLTPKNSRFLSAFILDYRVRANQCLGRPPHTTHRADFPQ